MRADELAASAKIIGFDEVEMLGYRDSGMADTEPNNHPECFHQADIDEATGRLVAIIRRTRAQVIITYGDDQAGYPHPDHLRVHDISVLAFERAGDPAWYPESGEPFTPLKLYYSVWSKQRILAVHEAILEANGESPFEAELARPSVAGSSHHHQDRCQRRTSGRARTRCGPTPPRSTRRRRGGSGSTTPRWPRSTRGRTGSSPVPSSGRIPAVDEEHDLFAGVRETVTP